MQHDDEVWQTLSDFPDYSVSDHGRVRSNRYGRLLTPTKNQNGTLSVKLRVDEREARRSVAVLVAKAFLPEPPNHHFNTPIHKDGNLSNNSRVNLAWRSRPYAILYHRQFQRKYRGRIRHPIEHIPTKTVYPNSWEAAIANGILLRELESWIFDYDTQLFRLVR